MVIFKKRRHMFPYVGPWPVKAPCHVRNSLQRVSAWDDGFAICSSRAAQLKSLWLLMWGILVDGRCNVGILSEFHCENMWKIVKAQSWDLGQKWSERIQRFGHSELQWVTASSTTIHDAKQANLRACRCARRLNYIPRPGAATWCL